MKKVRIAALSILAIAIIAGVIVWINSFSIATAGKGFSQGSVNTLDSGVDDNGDEYKIIQSSTDKQKVVLAYMVKSSMGFWTVERTETAVHPETKLVTIGWMRVGGVKRYAAADNPLFETEWHRLYYGENAIKLIEFLPGQIPDKVAVNIRQAGNEYSVHLISFEDPDVLNKIDMHALLLEAKCIKD